MIRIVNAKLNLGLNIVSRRPDGYHDLETVFLPVGLYNGTPENPEPFCDILEIVGPRPVESAIVGSRPVVTENSDDKISFVFSGRKIDCPPEKNLVVKASRAFAAKARERGVEVTASIELDKHLPDGAGLGGGSADATFTLLSLNESYGKLFTEDQLMDIAAKLGADCPFFVKNRPVYASGIGEIMEPVGVPLMGWWAVIIKPDVYVSTKEAFAGISPKNPKRNLRELIREPIETWKDTVINDFEQSLFPKHPILAEYKSALYESGAVYASMSGSGASLYGLYPDDESARQALCELNGRMNPDFSTVCKL